MHIDFVKTQSIGNDFVLIHDREVEKLVSQAKGSPSHGGAAVAIPAAERTAQVLGQFAQQVCDRRFGVGSDGLLVLGKKGKTITLRMFNPDGTEDFCGNGLRCAAVCAHDEGLIEGSEFVIEHLGVQVESTLLSDGQVRTKLGVADYTPAKVPVISSREIFKETVWSGMIGGMPLSFFGSALTTGTTHVVIPTVSFPDDESFVAISSAIEKDPKFPDHTSVIWTKEIEPRKLSIRIWERGAGETQGCGTGSSAAAADYLRRRDLAGVVEVLNPGGSLKISMDAWNAPITAESAASIVYRGRIRAAL